MESGKWRSMRKEVSGAGALGTSPAVQARGPREQERQEGAYTQACERPALSAFAVTWGNSTTSTASNPRCQPNRRPAVGGRASGSGKRNAALRFLTTQHPASLVAEAAVATIDLCSAIRPLCGGLERSGHLGRANVVC